MKREDLEALVRDVVAASPEGPLEDQHPGFQRMVARWAAEESERTGREVTPEDYYARGRAAHDAEVGTPEDAEATDAIVAAARRG
ncbi:hypothetical protein QFZ62_000698 [Clavibacter sp. B3I6]|uniref:hypothetical protein n=1 Tax=Clavibacter sp. B3I6 TaxID=3042268 RepID=UPI00277D5677|nr:hypothetical protein [Clavibacter sp. B3I6]MDQ0743390.1 hypothetical protein [Clavibacter sp. B3I6]